MLGRASVWEGRDKREDEMKEIRRGILDRKERKRRMLERKSMCGKKEMKEKRKEIQRGLVDRREWDRETTE